MSALAKALALLAEHADLIELVVEAIDRGVSKNALADAVRATMIATSDAAMREELAR